MSELPILCSRRRAKPLPSFLCHPMKPLSSPCFRGPTAIAFGLLIACWAASPLRAQRLELSDPKSAPVVVESLDVTTEVTGRIAVTTFDLVFHNPNPRVLEGTFL